jgi:alkanesulfonate monooxygenase SsuD/methylene tetrahydromethanopterin reductase-like flavin-dependent oxidoreductase (luciferase family)
MASLTFGVDVSTSASTIDGPVTRAKAAEDLGYDFVSASDHPSGSHPTFETWTLLTWIAAATSRISVASRVLSLPFRSPALVAKMAESLDRLSQGRLILGLGAGATDDELHRFGLPAPSPRDKIDGLNDALHILHGLWSERGYDYHGSIHQTNRAEMEPKPAHRIPIWLGTFGDRALVLTGRYADGWIPSLGHAPLDQLPIMCSKVIAAAESVDRNLEDFTWALNLEIAIGDLENSDNGVIAGPVESIVERLQSLVTMGFNAFNFIILGPDPMEQAEQLATEVIPVVRGPEV